MSAGTVSAAELDAARLILGRMGITPEDLLRDADRAQAPTFAEYVPVVSAAVSAGTRRVYGSYWNRLVEHWGPRRLDEPTPSEVKQLSEYVRTHVVKRRNGRGGRGASEHLIAALRCLYNHAIADGVIRAGDNPAGKVAKPRRLQSTRRAVPPDRIAEINQAAASSGNDPQLDTLILRIHQETACRRGGALALTPADLDPDQCLVLLKEKGDTQRWQPVSPTLMQHLLAHAAERGVAANERLLRYRTGQPCTYRRYDHLWRRLGGLLPWVAVQGISAHWLRHTTLTWVERHFGYAVARAYAGHTETTGDVGTTATYVRASVQEVAAALSALTGERHPLA